MSASPLQVAVLGATGLVGRKMIQLLEQRRIPVGRLRLLGSERSVSRSIEFHGESIPVELATHESMKGNDLILSSAGSDVSRELLPTAAAAGSVCIDNTNAFRMDDGVPLVVPEVNGHRLDDIRLREAGSIIASPNCSTIQLVVALKPLHDAARIRNVVVSTYQSISGAGREALRKFEGATDAILNRVEDLPESLQGTAAFDALPQIGDVGEDGFTGEETKMARETPKIMEAEIGLDVTCVRVPVMTGHAESVLIETEEPLTEERAVELLSAAPGVQVDSVGAHPTPRAIAGEHAVHVGRIRRSLTNPRRLQLWVVADNLLKGASLNAIQIAEHVLDRNKEVVQRAASAYPGLASALN